MCVFRRRNVSVCERGCEGVGMRGCMGVWECEGAAMRWAVRFQVVGRLWRDLRGAP